MAGSISLRPVFVHDAHVNLSVLSAGGGSNVCLSAMDEIISFICVAVFVNDVCGGGGALLLVDCP